MRSRKHMLAALALSLTAPFAALGAQSSDPTYSTTTVRETDLIHVYTNGFTRCVVTAGRDIVTETCTITTYTEVCNRRVSYTAFIDPATGTWVIIVVHSVSYDRVPTGSTSTESTHSVPFLERRYFGWFPFGWYLNSSHSLVCSERDVFAHDIPDAISGTFENKALSPGEEIDLITYGPGTYTYTVVRSDGVSTSTHVYTITVDSSHRLEQVDQPSSTRIVPTSLFEFTNETSDDMYLVLKASSNSPLVDVYLPHNVAWVAPGETIQREVLFTTTAGNSIREGETFSAFIDAYSVEDHLSRVEVMGASRSLTRGSGEDLRIQSEVNNEGLPSLCTKSGNVGDTYTVTVNSPGGTFDGAPVSLYFDTYALGKPIQRSQPGTPFHLSAGHQSMAFGTMTPAGYSFAAPLPASMLGLVLRVQAVVVSPLAANGTHALSDAFDVRVE